MTKTLDEMLGLDGRVVLVKSDGTYEAAPYPPKNLAEYAPETIYVDYSGDWDMPDILDGHERDAIASIEGGWEVLTGWSADPSIFIMRNDQGIGESLKERILEEPGLWAAVPVDIRQQGCVGGDDQRPCETAQGSGTCEHIENAESESVGWALVHREIAGSGD